MSSSLLTAGIVYVLKRSFDRTLDLKYDQLLERSKHEIQEQARQRSAIYDQQAPVYRALLETIYRLRNLAREWSHIQLIGDLDAQDIEQFKFLATSLQEALFENRAILPESVFQPAHHAKNQVMTIASLVADDSGPTSAPQTTNTDDSLGRIARIASDLSTDYTLLVDLIQPRLGIGL